MHTDTIPAGSLPAPHFPDPVPSCRRAELGEINGTCLQGYVCVPFSKLVAILGEPEESDGYKVSAEWVLTFADGTVATIYDWKATDLYDSDNPSPAQLRAEDYDNWHVGGKSGRAVDYVRAFLLSHGARC
jgi:hypothetical protein